MPSTARRSETPSENRISTLASAASATVIARRLSSAPRRVAAGEQCEQRIAQQDHARGAENHHRAPADPIGKWDYEKGRQCSQANHAQIFPEVGRFEAEVEGDEL